MPVPEAPLEDAGSGLAPAGEGWFVVNARDAECWNGASAEAETPDPKQAYARFERPQRARPQYRDRLPWPWT